MRVVSFDTQEVNYLIVASEPYFVLRERDGQSLVTHDRCPHRGGPLHLGMWDSKTRSLRCPWHGTAFTHMALSRRAVPSVRTGAWLTVVLPVSPDSPVELSKRQVLANG
jgi:nitrite reductase (NADH) small subunit